MATSSATRFDDTGKVVFDDYYVQPDPRPYFTTDLRDLDYRIPGEAQPYFRAVIDAYRSTREKRGVTLVDLGCSYGVNAALLRSDLDISQLYDHYGDKAVRDLTREELVAHDRAFYQRHQIDDHLSFVGLDTSEPAVRYAEDAGLLQKGIATNLEEEKLTGAERDAVSAGDIVISTGAVGYITERTVGQVMDAIGDRRPWMAHCVLRMFSFEPMAEMLRANGYEVQKLPGTLRQRRFANPEERAHVFENLAELDLDPEGFEADGWYHAEVFVARPKNEATIPIARP